MTSSATALPTPAEFVLGVDLGSGGCKATLLGRDSRVYGTVYVPYTSEYPRAGWVEQNPDQWVDAAGEAIAAMTERLDAGDQAKIRSLIFTGPTHVAVLLDAHDRPLRRSIMWNDQRSGDQATSLASTHGALIREVTHNEPSATWTLSQFAWLSAHEPDVVAHTRRIVFMKDYVREAFTGSEAHVTDRVEAGGTLYWDIRERRWSTELLGLVGFANVAHPEIREIGEIAGKILPDVADRLRLSRDVDVLVGTTDSAAELVAAGANAPGDAVVKLATAGSLQIVTDELPRNTKLLTYEHVSPGRYYVNAATSAAAASFRWFRESFVDDLARTSGQDPYAITEADVASTPVGSEGLIFHPYLNGERSPLWDTRRRGSFVGISPRHERRHFARAVMEGVALSIRHAASDHDVFPVRARLVGGGAKSPTWAGIVADVMGIEVEVPAVADSSAGAAVIAGVARGWYADVSEGSAAVQRIEANHLPRLGNSYTYDQFYDVYVALSNAMAPVAGLLRDLAESGCD